MITYNNSDLKSYENVFETLNLLIKNNILSSECVWQISCGEITIHPLKKQIYDFTRNRKTTYYTNCCFYDKELSSILKQNNESKINFSIDCGNSITWNKIKGINNFDKVISNLTKYINNATVKQIELKYILLTGINDDDKNFFDIIRIMKERNLDKIIIARNYDIEITDELIKAKNRFTQLLNKNNIIYVLSSF